MNDDKAKHKILPSKFGLVQITRQGKTRNKLKKISKTKLIIIAINQKKFLKSHKDVVLNVHPLWQHIQQRFSIITFKMVS
jgi:hypothetical protein